MLRVDFIFSREGLTEENGVTSLNEHADSLEKVTTTVKRVARVIIIMLLGLIVHRCSISLLFIHVFCISCV